MTEAREAAGPRGPDGRASRAGRARGRAPLWRTVAGWYERRPFLTAWGGLAGGMVLLVILFGWDAGLTLRQHATLAAISVGLAWLCVWIVFWEDTGSDDGSRQH